MCPVNWSHMKHAWAASVVWSGCDVTNKTPNGGGGLHWSKIADSSKLQWMQQLRLGATVHGLYAGAFAHADDIRTVTPSISFTQENRLTLVSQKREKYHRQNTQRKWWAPLINNSWSPRMQQNVWDSGGPGTFLQKHQWMKLWRKPGVPFSFLEEWVLSKETWTRCREKPYLKCVWFHLFCMAVKIGSWQKICYWVWRVFKKKLEGGSSNSLDFIQHQLCMTSYTMAICANQSSYEEVDLP